MYIVYILKCADGKPYTGCTENLEERLERHKNGHVPTTKDRRPVKLITSIVFSDKYKAFAFEKYLKSGSGRAFTKNIYSVLATRSTLVFYRGKHDMIRSGV